MYIYGVTQLDYVTVITISRVDVIDGTLEWVTKKKYCNPVKLCIYVRRLA